MRAVPILDWTCTLCEGTETWELVKMRRESDAPQTRAVPILDWTCAQCEGTETWELVKMPRESDALQRSSDRAKLRRPTSRPRAAAAPRPTVS